MVTESCLLVLLATGAVLIGIGLPLGISFPYIFSSLLQLQLQLTSSSATFSEWKDSPVPVYMDMYMWNWTNAEEFAANKSLTPSFEEIGPFVFQIVTDRANVVWNDNHTVTFSPNRTYLYQPNMSLDLNTMITTLSPVPAVLSYYGRLWTSKFFLALVDREVQLREEIFKTDTAGNWLFYGINDTLFDLIVPLKNIAELPLPFDKFAWFNGRNHSATAEGSFTMHTGTDDLANLGKLALWKGVNRTDAYSGRCGEVGGTTGELLPPMDEKPATLSVFSADVCSQVELEYKGEIEQEGIPGWEFVGSPLSFDDGELYPEEACFCTGECVAAGVRNISVCKFGSPAFVSFPHFYLADDSFTQQKIEGMKPEKSKHEFSLLVEPTTGIPLSVHAQLQINLRVQASESIGLYGDMPDLYIPMLWFREHAAITPDLASLLNLIIHVQVYGIAVTYTIGVIGLIMVGSSWYVLQKHRVNKEVHIVSHE